MDRFKRTGILPVPTKTPIYMDTTQVPDLQQAHHVMIAAEKAFNALPADVRKEFNNNPVEFVDFATKQENIEQLRKWGLAKPEEKEPEPMKVRVITDTPPAGDQGKP